MVKTSKPKKNLGESICQQLKNIAVARKLPIDEILRYYAIERFLYRLSISAHAEKFFLKGGLMLKVWDSENHRATMDIDLLARISNQIDNLQYVIKEISAIQVEEDAIVFNTQNLILHNIQTTGDYEGISASFSAEIHTTRIPILIDIGFNDLIIPKPCSIEFPILLSLPAPKLLGYTPETVVAEKFESIVKLGLVNTRMKDFYDLWTIYQHQILDGGILKQAIEKVFANRQTPIEHPISFTNAFYDDPATIKRWENFLIVMRKDMIPLREVISKLSIFLKPFIEDEKS